MSAGAEALSDLVRCEQCEGFYAVESKDGGKPVVRCNSCGHVKELEDTPREQPSTEDGAPQKWTVIGPDGKVMTFTSWDELTGSIPPPPVAPTPSISAIVQTVEPLRPLAASPPNLMDAAPKAFLPEEPAKVDEPAKAFLPEEPTRPVEMVEMEPAAKAEPVREPRRISSASALLDITPTPDAAAAKLSSEAESDANLGALVRQAKLALDKERQEKEEREKEVLAAAAAATAAAAAAAAATAADANADAEKDVAQPAAVVPPVGAIATPAAAAAAAVPLARIALARVSTRRVTEIVEAPPDSIEELDSNAVLEDSGPDSEDAAPLSLSDAIVEEDHETLSLKDLVVVPPAALVPPADAPDSTPPPPAKGVLGTLATKGAAPPPTISVEEIPVAKKVVPAAEAKAPPPPPERKPAAAEAKSATTAETRKDVKAEAPRDLPPKPKPISEKKDEPRLPPKPVAPKTDSIPPGPASRRPAAVASARAALADEPPKRGWIVPSIAVIAVAVVIWRIMAASPKDTPVPPTVPTTPATTTAPPPTTSPTATDTVPNPTTSSSAPTTPSASASVPAWMREPVPTNVGSGTAANPEPPSSGTKNIPNNLSMSEMLDRAGAARRGGDFATARELYERILRANPGNVEANGGLGDVARAQGDNAAAKASYERALAASPSYGPAQLGLADVEWDLGNRASAQRRYADIVTRLGDRAPERAKQRGTVAAPPE